jgi:deoxyribose-phosphate aldolase
MKYSKFIDHSLLHPKSTQKEVEELCKEAIEYNVAAVCLKPDSVAFAYNILKKTSIAIATVIGFPHGGSTIETKVFETQNAIKNGAQEIDVVVNIGKVKEHNWAYIKNEISSISTICQSNNVILKVIFETGYLRDDEILRLCKICTTSKVNYVKTSTGFDFEKDKNGLINTIGAKIKTCELMAANIPNEVKLKASGGIRNTQDFLAFIDAGASRIGTSSTKEILEGLKKPKS